MQFILGAGEVAVEVKSAALVRERHLKGIRAFKEEHQARRYIVVSTDPRPRKTEDGIDILPWRDFLDQLWAGNLIFS